jgi:hypothetical protein
MKRLSDDETLDWHDLLRRLCSTFPDLKAMRDAYNDWAYWREKMHRTYRNIDNNADGKMTQKGAIASARAARKAWKRKH